MAPAGRYAVLSPGHTTHGGLRQAERGGHGQEDMGLDPSEISPAQGAYQYRADAQPWQQLVSRASGIALICDRIRAGATDPARAGGDCARASALPAGVHVCSSLDSAIEFCESPSQRGRLESLFVVGGSQVYTEALRSPRTTSLHLTRVDVDTACDTFIPDMAAPEMSRRFALQTSSEVHEENGIKYRFQTYEARRQDAAAAPAEAAGGDSRCTGSTDRTTHVRWSASRGKAVFGAQDIEAGATLWREPAVGALQYADSRQSGTMACRDSLRFVGTMEAQLQVLGCFSESEQAAGEANIDPELIRLMSLSRAAKRCSGRFVQAEADGGGGNDEIYADEAARDRATSTYNRWLYADPAAWAAFQEHALSTNETFVLAAQLLARYFSPAGQGESAQGNSGAGNLAEEARWRRRPADVLEGLISELWWELPSGPGGAATCGELPVPEVHAAGSKGRDDEEDEGGCEAAAAAASPLDVATSRRTLLEESFQLLDVVAHAAGGGGFSEELTIEMYSRMIGALELNSIAVEIQSPLAAFVDELLDAQLTDGSAGDDDAGAAAGETVGLRGQDIERAVELMLPHVERRLHLIRVSDAAHEADSDDCETELEPQGCSSSRGDGLPQMAAVDPSSTEMATQPPNSKRQRLSAAGADAASAAASDPSASVSPPTPPIARLRHIVDDAGGVDQLYPTLCGVGLFEGVANLNHDCEPNAVVVFEQDSTATVAALRPIQKGEEVCISYIDVDQPVDERRADLLDYGFVCSCARCQEETKRTG